MPQIETIQEDKIRFRDDARLQIRYVFVDDLILLDGNPKAHDIGAIWLSMAENGFRDPMAWDCNLNGGQGGIVEGNGRSAALKDAQDGGMEPPRGIGVVGGQWAVPVLFGCDARSETAAKRYAIDHNNLTMLGGDFTALDISRMYNAEEYAAFLESLAETDDLPLSVDGDDLDLLLQQLGEQEVEFGEDDEDAVSENMAAAEQGQIESRVKLGEIWQLGRHRIACGDCTNEANVRALLGNQFSDVGMVWADPPYGIDEQCNREEKGRDAIAANHNFPQIIGDKDNSCAIASFSLCQRFFQKRLQVWWGANYYPSALPVTPSWLVWDKRDGVLSDDNADCELAWTNQGKPARIFRHLWKGCIKASEHGQRRSHPTQKPIALCEWVFEMYGQSNDVIFDPFLGSAPSVIAAQKMEGTRTVYGFELSPEYCEVIIRRFEEFTGINAKLCGYLP